MIRDKIYLFSAIVLHEIGVGYHTVLYVLCLRYDYLGGNGAIFGCFC